MTPTTGHSDFASRPVGEIAATLPGATALFRREKLDFCCGGGATLADAAARRGTALEPLVAELATLSPSEPDTVTVVDTPQLIAHIVARATIRRTGASCPSSCGWHAASKRRTAIYAAGPCWACRSARKHGGGARSASKERGASSFPDDAHGEDRRRRRAHRAHAS